MKIIFEDKKEEPPTFGDVEENQFFINNSGYLCQKCSDYDFNFVADPFGNPYATNRRDEVSRDDEIRKILPNVAKIEF